MEYPIDVKHYIATMRMEFGLNEAAENVHMVIIPLVNTAYQDGVDGRPGYPLNPSDELVDFEAYKGKPAIALEIITATCNWCNMAYEQGRAEAGKGAKA